MSELKYSIVPSKGSPLCPDSEILAERHLYFSTVYIICFIIGRVILGARLSKYRRKRLATFDMSRSSRSTQFSTHRMYHVLARLSASKINFFNFAKSFRIENCVLLCLDFKIRSRTSGHNYAQVIWLQLHYDALMCLFAHGSRHFCVGFKRL